MTWDDVPRSKATLLTYADICCGHSLFYSCSLLQANIWAGYQLPMAPSVVIKVLDHQYQSTNIWLTYHIYKSAFQAS